jgi:hypothetical protein
MLAALDFITEVLQTAGELRPVDRRGELLRAEQTPCVHGSRPPVLAFSHIEDNGMGVELRRGIAGDGPRGVVLEGRGGELAGQLRRIHIAEPGLRVSLQLAQSDSNTLPVRLADPLIASHQGGERNRLRS